MPTLSPAHAAERLQAARLPAHQATLARLTGGSGLTSTLTLYDHADPADVAATALVALPLTEQAGAITVDDTDPQAVLVTLTLDTPLEAQVTGADESMGSTPLSARLTDPAGAWVMDLTVSLEGEGGEIELPPNVDDGGTPVVRLYNGALARITAAVLEG